MGDDKVTTKNLKIVEIDEQNSIISIKGAVPGARNGLVLISGEGELKLISRPALAEISVEKEAVADNKEEVKKEEKAETPKVETPEEVEKEVVEAKEKVDQKKESK